VNILYSLFTDTIPLVPQETVSQRLTNCIAGYCSEHTGCILLPYARILTYSPVQVPKMWQYLWRLLPNLQAIKPFGTISVLI